ncbi:hypothetical protein ACXIT2_23330, partial [Vibrio parahaemolyticus]
DDGRRKACIYHGFRSLDCSSIASSLSEINIQSRHGCRFFYKSDAIANRDVFLQPLLIGIQPDTTNLFLP